MELDPTKRTSDLPAFRRLSQRAVSTERRKRNRVQVHWALTFSRPGGAEITTITQDLSSNGFYCLAQPGFVPGEVRQCMLAIPTYDPNGVRPTLRVFCRVRVIRVEMLGESGLCGVGCEIEDYRFMDSAAVPDHRERLAANG